MHSDIDQPILFKFGTMINASELCFHFGLSHLDLYSMPQWWEKAKIAALVFSQSSLWIWMKFGMLLRLFKFGLVSLRLVLSISDSIRLLFFYLPQLDLWCSLFWVKFLCM